MLWKKHTDRLSSFIVIRVTRKLVFGINVWANMLKAVAKNEKFENFAKKPKKPKAIF